LVVLVSAVTTRAEVMLQWFETEWDEIYRRLPEVAEIGYDYLWLPPPTKAPTGKGTKWGNVGYSLYDRFDLGDIPQRGSLATRYGTRGDLRNMVDKAHQCDVKIIPDIVMNHNGNGPDFRCYPGMSAEDFHVQWEAGHANGLNYKRGPRMGYWSADGGYGGTLWQELCSLIDIRTEDHPYNGDQLRFTGGNNTPGWDFVGSRPSFLRHPGQFDKYPDYPGGYGNEKASELLYRWIAWLGNAMDFDGLRLDAAKHVEWEFFGERGRGFLHEAQYNYNLRRGYSDGDLDEADELFANYLAERDDALIFAEILSHWSEIEYWYGYGTNNRNPMRFLDYAIKKTADSALNGNIGNFHGYGKDFGPNNGVMYIWGHDEGPAGKVNLGYAYILTHVGFPMVYFTGNNITWDDHNVRTWMRPGYDSHALSDSGDEVANLVWVHQQFARGAERDLWHDGDYLALERYDDKAASNKGLLISAMNDSGWDIQKSLQTSFNEGMILHDYTGHFQEDWGHGPGNIRVGAAGAVEVKVPGGGGEGWVCFAPLIPENMELDIAQEGSPVPTLPWLAPGGIHGAAKLRHIKRITSADFTVNARFTPPAGGAVDSVMLKWGQGLNLTTNYFSTARDVVSGRFEKMVRGSDTNWWLTVPATNSTIPEGLNVIKCRAFVERGAGEPALFNTETEVVYVDRRGPEVEVLFPGEGSTVNGDCVMQIANPDYTAFEMTVSVDGGAAGSAREVMKGTWRHALRGLSSGTHTVRVTTTEADWGASRAVINTSIVERAFSVAPNTHPIALTPAHGTTCELPFFDVAVDVGGESPDDVKLYWDGYELPFNGGALTHTFNGEVVYAADPANVVTDRLWGSFCNGAHFFEAVRVDGGVTSRTVNRVVFDLYGIGAIDSDGDGLPDNVEMPFIDSQGAPGADAPWPGDDNRDFVPNYGEHWTRLNPYNHSTFYSGQWDDRNDFDGDGYSNGDEVLAGYHEGDIYKYSIYDSGSSPSGTPADASGATWSPEFPVRGQTVTVTYSPNDGPLRSVAQVVLHIGHSKKTRGGWQDVIGTNMSPSGADWTVDYVVPSNATSVDFVFHDGAHTWDNNNGSDWQIAVQGSGTSWFGMDGVVDSADYLVHGRGMHIWCAARGENLYVATWGTGDQGGSDHFIYVADEPGDAAGLAPAWNKAGLIFCDTSRKPYLGGESQSDWKAWHNVAGSAADAWNGVLEGEINLVDAFGYVPEAVYVAAVAHESQNDGPLVGQGPDSWNGDGNVDVTELLRVPIASVRDEDLDGAFDGGNPLMWTVVGGNTNDANYGLRRFFINELAGETAELTVILEPRVGADALSDVELFSNLNRRDFAVMPGDEDWDTVDGATSYYRACAMTDLGGGRYRATVTVRKCGAYRLNARWRVNGGDYVYYTDGGLRRDCAIVVSPRKALELVMYELNPMFAEATNDTFGGRSTFEDMTVANADRPDVMNTNRFTSLGVNMVWLQPIHPIGFDGRQTDPDTGGPFEPGSPYAVRNYWKVNAVLGDPSSEARAMAEFTNFVRELDAAGVGVMLDGTFNHSAWDCEVGVMGVEMGITTSTTALIRDVRPQWYSKENSYGEHATRYGSATESDIAVAPDRIDFGKWPDAADFRFGVYAALVRKGPSNTNNAWSSPWFKRQLREDDWLAGLDAYSREVWEYFAAYPLYWLEKTGHPAGTAAAESHRGIDGLRCDFAQGLPSRFWEYCINRTRSVKWDFIFMAESLDGFAEVGGSKRHGVGYRSARHFDVLNENIVFYWRNDFFAYPYQGAGGANWGKTPVPETLPTKQAVDARRQAFDASPLLLNLSSHDEVYPSHDPYRLLYAHAQLAALDGVPMLLYGQEAGARNDHRVYNFNGEIPDASHNFARYEQNFGKSIPNFKRYNSMRNIWDNSDPGLQAVYARINNARRRSPALRSRELYFLSRKDSDAYDPKIFALAKYEQPGVSAATQDVVFVFVNNNYWSAPDGYGTNVSATFKVDVDYGGSNRFGIEAERHYNLVDLMSTTPADYVWATNYSGAHLIANGIGVWLHDDPRLGGQAQYLRLVDAAVGPDAPDNDADGDPDFSDWDDDNDGLPDWYEALHGMDSFSAVGIDGAGGDKDGDGASNLDEFRAGTAADDASDVLAIDSVHVTPSGPRFSWPARPLLDYRVESTEALDGASPWDVGPLRTAASNRQSYVDTEWTAAPKRYYRVRAAR